MGWFEIWIYLVRITHDIPNFIQYVLHSRSSIFGTDCMVYQKSWPMHFSYGTEFKCLLSGYFCPGPSYLKSATICIAPYQMHWGCLFNRRETMCEIRHLLKCGADSPKRMSDCEIAATSWWVPKKLECYYFHSSCRVNLTFMQITIVHK